jgi:hypothetical protein
VAEKLIGVETKGERQKQRLNFLTHFAYGSAWGIPRALMELFGFRGWEATAAHFAAVQTTAVGMLPVLGVAPPPTEWPKKQIGIETVHHGVYAGANGLALAFLDRRTDRAHLAA